MRLFVGIVFVCLLHTAALAADCGDTTGPGGTRVPCACGDTVTTTTVLRKTDPVVSTGPSDVCEEWGLTVKGRVVLLNCDGLTLRGAGVGLGVVLHDEGSFMTVQDCTIRGFKTGILDAGNLGTVIESNTIIENVGAGIDLMGGGFITVRKNKVMNNGGNGILCEDTCSPVVYEKNRLIGNAGHGLVTNDSSSIQILGNAVQYNGGMGIRVDEGSNTSVTNNHVHYNGLDGIWVNGEGYDNFNTIARNLVSDNGGAGISLQDANANTIIANSGKRNGGNGLEMISVEFAVVKDNSIADNEFNRNGGHGICADPPNIDGGGNIGKNNGVLPDVTFDGC